MKWVGKVSACCGFGQVKGIGSKWVQWVKWVSIVNAYSGWV